MSPLTRRRAGDGRVPNTLMAEYYRQRAGAGLIVSEATSVSAQGVGYIGTPGIWTEAQTEGWKLVTEAVHGEGGRRVLQLWHVGRNPTRNSSAGNFQSHRAAFMQPAGCATFDRNETTFDRAH